MEETYLENILHLSVAYLYSDKHHNLLLSTQYSPFFLLPGAAHSAVITEIHGGGRALAPVHGVDDPALVTVPGLLLVAETPLRTARPAGPHHPV